MAEEKRAIRLEYVAVFKIVTQHASFQRTGLAERTRNAAGSENRNAYRASNSVSLL